MNNSTKIGISLNTNLNITPNVSSTANIFTGTCVKFNTCNKNLRVYVFDFENNTSVEFLTPGYTIGVKHEGKIIEKDDN